MKLHFDQLFTGSDWKSHWELDIDASGRIAASRPGIVANADRHIEGLAVPGFVNIHSHAFQRAMVGLTEHRFGGHDSFWTWRDWMYRFVLRLDPEDCYVIARQLYREMLAAGYTCVTEFHYLHQDRDGESYADPLAMSEAVVRAADEVGIRMVLLPALYQTAGFAMPPLTAAQRRFVLSDEAFVERLRGSVDRWQRHPRVRVGAAMHSLRAVPIDVLERVVAQIDREFPGIPVHLHIAEQVREIDDCQAHLGCRPLALLLTRCELSSRWCLIHATHLDANELASVRRAGALVGLCPTTEANLGDGIFDAPLWRDLGGAWAIGSDSQIAVNPIAELRMLEYGQRLKHQARGVLCDATRSVGRWLLEGSSAGFAHHAGLAIGRLDPDFLADFLVLDTTHPQFAGREHDRLLDSWILGDLGDPIREVYVGGGKAWSVEEAADDASERAFAARMRALIRDA